MGQPELRGWLRASRWSVRSAAGLVILVFLSSWQTLPANEPPSLNDPASPDAEPPAVGSSAVSLDDQETVETPPVPLSEGSSSGRGPAEPPGPPGSGTVKMNLGDCIALALRRNVSIRMAYMDRALARFNFVTQHDYAFRPNVAVSLTGAREGSGRSAEIDASTGDDKVTTALNVTNRLPTGGSVTLAGYPWSRARSRSQQDGEASLDLATIDRSWSISLTQPLLRGAFTDYGTSDRRRTEIGEGKNILALKEALMTEIVGVIHAYRNLLQARWALDINGKSLDRARAQLGMNEQLVEMGRMPKLDLVQSRSDVANRELSFESATNAYDQARIALLKLLDLDVTIMIEPVEDLSLPSFSLTEPQIVALVQEQQPGYLTSRLDLEASRIDLMRSRRDQRWDLSLNAAYTRARTDLIPGDASKGHAWSVGLGLDIPVYGSDRRSLRSAVLGSENELRKAEIRFRKLEDNLRLEARDQVRQIRTLARQVDLASEARHLAEQKLEFEREKLKAGRTTNFQVVAFQDEVRNAHITELTARIAYLNALDDLDRYMGTTVRTWGVTLNENAPERGPEMIASGEAGLGP